METLKNIDEIETINNVDDKYKVLPLLALRGLCVFPGMNLHFDVGRVKSVNALNEAMSDSQLIFLVSQKDVVTDKPEISDLYTVGTVSKIKQILKLSGENLRVVVEGLYRAKVVNITKEEPYFEALLDDEQDNIKPVSKVKSEAQIRNAQNLFIDYSSLAPKLSSDLMLNVMAAKTPGELADIIASNIPIKLEQKQNILEEFNQTKRLNKLALILESEIEILDVERDLRDKVRGQIDKNQREYYLREQLKVIQNELGEGESNLSDSMEYKDRIYKLSFPQKIEEKLIAEANRLIKMPYGSSEGAVIRTYLDTCLELPWQSATKDRLDLPRAKKILDRDHFGLDKVKERILEFLAVKKLASDKNAQIICLVGPPGVGKTSIGISIAQAMGRKYARISLGGIRDEAEIRGHRKTYIGAMPGRIINAVKQAGSKNPVIVLDEIDKISSDFRGDPYSAMLEVLDPEQNKEFRDHYLEIPFDLSDVLFITTANRSDPIPRPLLDRMEVIEITSYTTFEKFNICKNHLIPKQLAKHGIPKTALKFDDAAIIDIIDGYTVESGVRNLERNIAKICRKAAVIIVEGKAKQIRITKNNIEDYLGSVKFTQEKISKTDQVGVATGLAWTSAGGDILSVEVNVMDGSGKVELTGLLGDVMKESAHAAISYIRSKSDFLPVEKDFYKTKDIHIHFPEGAIPKDGPSAGITIATALISALTNIAIKRDVAMTGEITLRGRVLAIGGLKEKTMAAYKAGVKTVLVPFENKKDIVEIDQTVKENLSFIYVSSMDDVCGAAFVKNPLSASPVIKENVDIIIDATEIKKSSIIRQ